jgi:hypothetical protein
LNKNFIEVINQWAEQILPQEQNKVELAKKIGCFGKSLYYFPLGRSVDC